MIIAFVSNGGSRRNVSRVAMRFHTRLHVRTHTYIDTHTQRTTKWRRDEDILVLETVMEAAEDKTAISIMFLEDFLNQHKTVFQQVMDQCWVAPRELFTF